MHVGCQYFATDPISMSYLQRFGVSHIDVRVDDMEVETLTRVRDEAAAYDISLELVHLPGGCADSIKLAQDPQRDRDIDEFCRSIENAGKAGLRGICWHCAPSTAFAALFLALAKGLKKLLCVARSLRAGEPAQRVHAGARRHPQL